MLATSDFKKGKKIEMVRDDEQVLPQAPRFDPAQHPAPVLLLGGVHDVEGPVRPAAGRAAVR